MNTQEVIELLNLQKIQAKQEVADKYQVDKATVIRVHTNDKYDLSNGMVNIQPLDTSKKFSVGDSVFLQIPVGDKQQIKIVARSNIKIPDEELYEYGDVPSEGTIYLGCPDDVVIKVYSLDGTPGVDISLGPNAIYNIISQGDYLYCSGNTSYWVFRIKRDGADYQEIIGESRYYNAHGLAINPAGTHLYTAYDIWGETYGIAKINISTGEVGETEITDVSFDEIKDLCGDANIYILGNYSSVSQVAIYNFDGNFISDFLTSENYNKIATDGDKLYLNTDSKVDIYTTAGSLIQSIEGII